jgi:predicted RNase H-like nuclease (RuvC/YqgF family)
LKIHGDANVADMKAKIRALKIELQDLNDQFQRTVDKTKRQNDENHKIYEQDALINRLKVKIEKKTIRARANYENLRKVLSKTEIFKYGYTKTFNDSNLGIM